MAKLKIIIILIFFLNFYQTYTVFACRYNVRETGFVDLSFDSYFLYWLLEQDSTVEINHNLEKISQTALNDSNVRAEIINIKSKKENPAFKYIDLFNIQSFPAAVIVSPNGQSMLYSDLGNNQPFDQLMKSALNDILYSPKRDEIIDKLSKNYGVVLLIEGIYNQENSKAREAILNAIERIKKFIKFMPKTIIHPPVLVSIAPEFFSRERILLWSLGLGKEKIIEPYAAVLYGKARWIGPLIKGKSITETTLFNLLSVIGADCECGLDKRWLRGTMLPVKWNDKIQAQVTKNLGFDPENPMIRMEISQIMRLGINGSRNYPGVPFGYEEYVRKLSTYPNTHQNTDLPVPFVEDSIRRKSIFFGTNSVFKKTFFILVALSISIFLVGLFIILKKSKKKP